MARNLLNEWGTPVNDPHNGVFLPGVGTSKYHYFGSPGIHTDTYFESVYYLLRTAKDAGATAADAREILVTIAADLQTGSFPY